MIKTIENGVIKINELSFLEFSNRFRGYFIISKVTGRSVPKFLLYWSGISVAEAKIRFSLERRKNDD